MTFTFYPKALLVTAVFAVMFGATLLLAIDVRRGIAAAGMLGVLAYVLVEVVMTVNPSWIERSQRRLKRGAR